MNEDFGLLICAALGGAAYLAYNGSFFVTGKQWYEECYVYQSQKKTFSEEEPKAPDPYKAAIWKQCDSISERSIYSQGLMWSPLPKNDQDLDGQITAKSCPNIWNDKPIGGTQYLAMKLVQEHGGPNFLDSFLPAEFLIGRNFVARWPQCNAERQRQGYPKIVEVHPGEFAWATPCTRCEAKP